MKCYICDGEIKNGQHVKLFGYTVCSLCFYEIGKVCVDSMFYNFYKDKIKDMLFSKPLD